MVRPVKQIGSSAVADGDLATVAPAEQQAEQQRDPVNLGDTAAIKRTLDDAAAQVVLASNFREDFTVSNIKIGLGLFTCCWALLAQFYPKKYPYTWHVLLGCLIAYVICTTVLNVLMWYMEGDTFLFARPQQDKQRTVLTLASTMPKYQDVYTLTFQNRQGLIGKTGASAKLQSSVAAFFDSKGNLVEEAYKQSVERTLRSFRATKKTT